MEKSAKRHPMSIVRQKIHRLPKEIQKKMVTLVEKNKHILKKEPDQLERDLEFLRIHCLGLKSMAEEVSVGEYAAPAILGAIKSAGPKIASAARGLGKTVGKLENAGAVAGLAKDTADEVGSAPASAIDSIVDAANFESDDPRPSNRLRKRRSSQTRSFWKDPKDEDYSCDSSLPNADTFKNPDLESETEGLDDAFTSAHYAAVKLAQFGSHKNDSMEHHGVIRYNPMFNVHRTKIIHKGEHYPGEDFDTEENARNHLKKMGAKTIEVVE